MNTPALLFGCGLAAVAVYLLRLAKQEMHKQKLVKGLTQARIRDVQPGLCLVEGVVESREPLSTPLYPNTLDLVPVRGLRTPNKEKTGRDV